MYLNHPKAPVPHVVRRAPRRWWEPLMWPLVPIVAVVMMIGWVATAMAAVVRPGTNISVTAERARGSDPTDTGVTFVPFIAERGPVGEAVRLRSLDDYIDTYGARDAGGFGYDAVETLFREGAGAVYGSRVAGPAATVATATANDRAGVPVPTLRIDAAWPGDAGARITYSIQDGAAADTYVLIVEFDGAEVERSPELATPAAAEAWSEGSDWVDVTDLVSATAAPNNNPAVVADVALVGGNDDRAAITLAEVGAALDAFTDELGPGQVIAPGWTTTAAHELLIDHGAARNRTAPLDAPDLSTKAALRTLRDGVKAREGARRAALFGFWVTIPSLNGTARKVPGSVFVAAKIAESDAVTDANTMPIGEAGRARWATGATYTFSDDDMTDLYDDCVNVALDDANRGLRLNGFRSVSDDDAWRQFNWSRYAMSLQARFRNVGEDHRGGKTTKATLADLANDLALVLLDDYRTGAIYGDTPDDAYEVDVDDPVNTPETIAAGEKHARARVTMTPSGDTVFIDLVKRPIA